MTAEEVIAQKNDALLQVIRIASQALQLGIESEITELPGNAEAVQRLLQRIAPSTPTMRLVKPISEEMKTYGDWLAEWFETYKRPVLKSWRQTEIAIRLHIPQWLKVKNMDDISGSDVQRALNEVNTSRNRETVYNIYTESFRMARGEHLTSNDPMLILKKPKHKREKGHALTREHQAEFLRLIQGHRSEAYFIHLLLTGSRPSEPLFLTPKDLDIDHNQLRIRGTKTDGADRYIPLFPAILQNLKKVELHRGHYFPYCYEYYQGDFEALHFYGHTLKDLRHTFATRGLESGVTMKTMQLWLGHSTYEQTANTYSEVQPLFESAQAARFEINLTPQKYDIIIYDPHPRFS